MSKIIWAKLDPGFYSNRKIIRAGRNGREVFQLALCINAARGAHGAIPAEDLEPWYVADQLRITEAEAQDGVARAIAAGLLVPSGDEVRIKGWGDDWARTKLERREIQANYRDRKGGKPERYQLGVTNVTDGNALPIREIREIRERDGVTLSRGGSFSGDSAAPGSDSGEPDGPRAPTKRGAQAGSVHDAHAHQQPIPAAWKPTQAAADLANELGLHVEREAAQFRRNAKAKGHTYADPDAAFELFLANSNQAGKRKPPKPGATTRAPRRERVQIDGAWFEDDGEGNLRPVAQSNGGSAT